MKRLGTLKDHLQTEPWALIQTQGFALLPALSLFHRYCEEVTSTRIHLHPIDPDRISDALHSFSSQREPLDDCCIALGVDTDSLVYLVPGSHLSSIRHFPRSAVTRLAIPSEWTLVLSPRIKHCIQVTSVTSATRFLVRLHR